MKEMMKRCLSLGFSLSVVFFSGLRRNATTTQPVQPVRKPEAVPDLPFQPEPVSSATFVGTVVRDGGRFALRDYDGALYALDSTGRAWPFEGEDVKVTGWFDPGTKLLHIRAIEEVEDLRAEAV